MEIKLNAYIKNYIGPSQQYFTARDRFDSILKNKLGLMRDTQVNGLAESDSVIFGTNEKSGEKEEFSSVQEGGKEERSKIQSFASLSKPISSIAMNGIVDTNDVRKKSNYSPTYLNSKLEGTPLAGLGEDFKRAEDLYGVNSLVLMAIAKLESNFGRSKIAREKNNLFGYQAYDSSPYSSAKSYATKAESIYDVAKHLSRNYLNEKGMYFNGYSVDAIGKKYCSQSDWAAQIKKITSNLIKG